MFLSAKPVTTAPEEEEIAREKQRFPRALPMGVSGPLAFLPSPSCAQMWAVQEIRARYLKIKNNIKKIFCSSTA